MTARVRLRPRPFLGGCFIGVCTYICIAVSEAETKNLKAPSVFRPHEGLIFSMTEPQVFKNSEVELRTVLIDGEPWFVAKDVCTPLGLAQTSAALRGLRETEKGSRNFTTPSGSQEMLIINEAGLYRLIMRSTKPAAAAFQDWVVGEVLPAIRKTGKYAIESRPLTQMEIVLQHAQALVEQERKLHAMELDIVEMKHRTALTQGEFFTIMGYGALIGRKIDLRTAVAYGKKAVALSRELGVVTPATPDARFGKVYTYHRDILVEVFKGGADE